MSKIDDLIREFFESPAGKEHMARQGRKGGSARASSLTAERRSAIARKAAKARWNPNGKAVRR